MRVSNNITVQFDEGHGPVKIAQYAPDARSFVFNVDTDEEMWLTFDELRAAMDELDPPVKILPIPVDDAAMDPRPTIKSDLPSSVGELAAEVRMEQQSHKDAKCMLEVFHKQGWTYTAGVLETMRIFSLPSSVVRGIVEQAKAHSDNREFYGWQV